MVTRHVVGTHRSARTTVVLWLVLSLLMSACSGGNGAGSLRLAAAPGESARKPLPPIQLPQDESPHRDLTEWWYYTGHLYGGGKRYGFELVTFQAVRGQLPPAYVAHFAVTDIGRRRFAYDQRSHTGPQPRSGYDLDVGGWRMGGLGGTDRVRAEMRDYAMDLTLTATKPVVLHDGDGVVEFGPAGDSYYYSRTRMSVSGVLTDHGTRIPVSGQAWMDHQWGNFISVAGGGWDWYSFQLDDGADLTISVVRDLEGRTVLSYGTYIDRNGKSTHLTSQDYSVAATGRWTSPRTGATYPSGWNLSVPSQRLHVHVVPAIPDQELDTRASTGVAYWEGAVDVTGTRAGKPASGVGYVELTGYSASAP